MTSGRVMVFTHTPMETHMMGNGCTTKGSFFFTLFLTDLLWQSNMSTLWILVITVFITSSVQLKRNGNTFLLSIYCISVSLLDMGRVHIHITKLGLSTWAHGSWERWSPPGSWSIRTTDIRATLSIIMWVTLYIWGSELVGCRVGCCECRHQGKQYYLIIKCNCIVQIAE